MSDQMRPATAEGVVTGTEGYGGPAATASTTPAPFVSQVPGTPVHFAIFHGRPVSWFSVSLILAGFVCGGLGLVFGPTWWAFWLGLALAVLGGLMALATGIFNDWY
jgi:hypothetical protein